MSLEAWKRKRTPIKGSLTRFKNKFDAYDKTLGVGTWVIQLNKFEPLYDQFNEIQSEIDLLTAPENEALESRERDEFENTYFEVFSQVNAFIEQTRKGDSSDSNSSRAGSSSNNGQQSQFTALNDLANLLSSNSLASNLPIIKIPKFDGSYKDWVKFRDSFKTMVHDKTSLTNIQKFHYLDDALTGEAARAIKSLGVSDANYELAWQSLLDRFEDLQSLVHFHMSALFELPVLSKVSYPALRQLIDDANNNLLALKSLGETTENWDTVIIHLLTTKLDPFTKREWEKRLISKRDHNPTSEARKTTFRDMIQFLENHCKYLERTSVDKPETNQPNNIKRSSTKNTNSKFSERLTSHATTKLICPLCQESHSLYNCEKFRALPIESRIDEVRKRRLCFNCLVPGHHNRQCYAGPCNKCHKKHNTLLHNDYLIKPQTINPIEQVTPPAPQPEPVNKTSAVLTNFNDSVANEEIMLGTAIVWVEDCSGKIHECRALLDSCSQVNIVTRNLCERLNLEMSNSDIVVSGVFKATQEPQYCTNLKFSSCSTKYSRKITCLVASEITDDMPNLLVRRSDFEIPKGIVLADPLFTKTRPVDLLIGAGLFWNLICVGQKHLRRDQPILQKTQLGWIVAGPMQVPSCTRQAVCNLITNQQLHDQVKQFWEIENHKLRGNFPKLDHNDELEQHFLSTTERDEDGRFVVTMPFKTEVNELGESLHIAERRFLSIERKLGKDSELREKYIEFMDDYEKKGHMELIPSDEVKIDEPINYFPHHAVKKEGSTTTSVRVVFDGSAETTSGLSFNQVQRVGPVVQNDLFSITLRFRQHPIVLSADIAKMYRQVKINKKQLNFQRILWRKDPSQTLQHFRLKTVTYGTASAPYLATRALRQVGEENKDEYPLASDIIIRNFYVDDMLAGFSSLEEAQQLKEEITTLLSSYGFELRKWASNERQVFDEAGHTASERIIKADKDPKTLGLLWKPEDDQLNYLVRESSQQRVTKRTILSSIAQIFDPLGLVGPAIIRAKIILQQLWDLQLDWDESLPQNLHTHWMEFSTQLRALNEISVPRFVLCKNSIKVQLHGFCDASENAYGACIFLRSTDKLNHVTTRLLCAKSRVAPLKRISVPRLELQAALLLAQLTESVMASLDLHLDQQYYWSDSTITLCWIKSSPSRWKTFVANRTSEIQELTNENWNHVRSEDNPADLISRGINPEELRDNELWWKGPVWLSQPLQTWPQDTHSENLENAPERKCTLILTTGKDFNWLERYSCVNKLIRITAYCLRLIHNLKNARELRNVGYLTTEERQGSLNCLLKLAQAQDFSSELKDLSTSKQVPSKSKLSSLNPFIDPLGILRVGGRLVNALIPFEQKHPAILSSKNPLTVLLIDHEHKKLLHAGCQTVMASLRTRFWPLNCKNAIKGVIKKCVKCFRAQPISPEYIMGNLPVDRVSPNRAFSTCGIDYAGPFSVVEKSRSRSVSKAYICIFVCFATKAVHIELARDMSTNAFFNCLYRFISRRGKCKHIYSDNGTNFVGARNELRELGQLLENNEFQRNVTDFLANELTTWHMIPPHAPNFGGLWESAVKSAKNHLKRVMGDTRLTFEELYTLLTQVEACLNSRPLSPISNDPNDLTPLTPGHFLIGDSLTALPQHDLREIRQNRLDRYQHIQFILQHFWQRWQREYLSQLQQRTKWSQPGVNQIKPGDMVIIRDDNLPPQRWKMGRIEGLRPGDDGVTRVVSINVGGSNITSRPLSKICLLPIDNDLIKLPE